MTNIIISGIYGKMGTLIRNRTGKEKDVSCVGGVDIAEKKVDEDIPVVNNIEEVIESADMVVDFSVAPAAASNVPVCVKFNKRMVIGTTGFSPEELKLLEEAGEKIPILYSSNMSIAVHLLYKLVAEASGVLKEGYDVEIVEKHHRYKKDAPSGTAIEAGKIVADKRGIPREKALKIGRKGFDERKEDDITIHAVRGGKIVSDHEIFFIGDNEIFSISHKSFSREIFVDGVMQGIRFISDRKSGLYSMKDVLNIS